MVWSVALFSDVQMKKQGTLKEISQVYKLESDAWKKDGAFLKNDFKESIWGKEKK